MTEKNPFDDLGDKPAEDAKAPAKEPAAPKAEKKTKAVSEANAKPRRTKEEKLADDIAAAKELLEGQGLKVVSPETKSLEDALDEFAEDAVTYDAVVAEKGAISAHSGQLVGTIDANGVAVPVLRLSLIGWIGLPPVEVAAVDGIADIEKILAELKKQAKEHAEKE